MGDRLFIVPWQSPCDATGDQKYREFCHATQSPTVSHGETKVPWQNSNLGSVAEFSCPWHTVGDLRGHHSKAWVFRVHISRGLFSRDLIELSPLLVQLGIIFLYTYLLRILWAQWNYNHVLSNRGYLYVVWTYIMFIPSSMYTHFMGKIIINPGYFKNNTTN